MLLSVFTAAFVGAWLGDLMGGATGGATGGSYGTRVAVYAALLLYVVVGAGVLFVKVAQHETAALSFSRVATWFASLWLWPLLLLARGRSKP